MGQLNFPGRMIYSSGRWGVEISESYRQVFEQILSTAAPETTQALIDATEELYELAYREWPVSPKTRRERNDGTVEWVDRWEYRTGRRDKKSKFHLTRGIAIEKGGTEIIGFVRNMAPWSWAVVWGMRSGGLGRRLGAKVGRDLIIKPGKKLGPKIAKIILDELVKAGKR